MEHLYEKALESAEYIKTHTKKRPKIAVVLGSGLGNLTADFTETEELLWAWLKKRRPKKLSARLKSSGPKKRKQVMIIEL